jgi:hypothetical protein
MLLNRRRIIRDDLAHSIGSGQVRKTSDSGHKVEPKRAPVGAMSCHEQMQQIIFA